MRHFVAWISQGSWRFWSMLTWMHHIIVVDLSTACIISGNDQTYLEFYIKTMELQSSPNQFVRYIKHSGMHMLFRFEYISKLINILALSHGEEAAVLRKSKEVCSRECLFIYSSSATALSRAGSQWIQSLSWKHWTGGGNRPWMVCQL